MKNAVAVCFIAGREAGILWVHGFAVTLEEKRVVSVLPLTGWADSELRREAVQLETKPSPGDILSPGEVQDIMSWRSA